MDIQITPKKTDGVERLLQVSVPASTVQTLEAKATAKYATKARLPGFRVGKAPIGVVKKKFADAIRQEVIEAVVRDAYQEVVTRENLKVVSQPHIHDLHWHDGADMSFELHLEVRPEVALDKVSGFTVERPKKDTGAPEVDEQLEKLRDQRATWTPVDSKPNPGDQVTVDLATTDDDGTMPEGKEYRLELGGGQAISGVEELIMEATPGQTVERPVKWPDDFPDEAQRGKTKTVRVTLKDVKRKEAPALDDAFAREIGDFDSLAALREAVEKDLKRHNEMDAESEVRRAILEKIIDANPFDLPPSWVNETISRYVQGYQVPEAEAETFATEFRPVAERSVRRDVIIELLAERHSLSAGTADVDAKIEEMATARKVPVSSLYASLEKAGRLPVLERELTEERVFGWLLAQNTVV